MTDQRKISPEESVRVQTKKTGLELLREPFGENHISKLPKPTKKQTEEVRNDFKKGIRCKDCGQWHHPQVQHLDYVGHAALTDRLLDCDPNWNWEPVAFDDHGRPLLDEHGGMWIKLTVCGQTRLGYGHPDGKRGGDAIKEVIGDALRNAGMRFGAALDLWHKGDLHADNASAEVDDDGQGAAPREPERQQQRRDPQGPSREAIEGAAASLAGADTMDRLQAIWSDLPRPVQSVPRVIEAKNARKADLTKAAQMPADHDPIDDEIPH